MSKYWFPCLVALLVMIESAPSTQDHIQFAQWLVGVVSSMMNLVYMLRNEE